MRRVPLGMLPFMTTVAHLLAPGAPTSLGERVHRPRAKPTTENFAIGTGAMERKRKPASVGRVLWLAMAMAAYTATPGVEAVACTLGTIDGVFYNALRLPPNHCRRSARDAAEGSNETRASDGLDVGERTHRTSRQTYRYCCIFVGNVRNGRGCYDCV